MTAREWKPGDVAAITDTHTGLAIEWRAHKDDKGWASLDPSIGWVADSDVQSARPLVVIDPEDREAVNRLADAFCDARWSHQPGREECDPLTRSSMQAALREFADPTPPKPEEPTGLGAVVEDRDGIRWVRSLRADVEFSTPWRDCNDDHFARHYDAIAAVRVLSEGVTQ